MRGFFGRLGGSWKNAAKVSPELKRGLHGRSGQGRLQAFALGEQIRWVTTAVNAIGSTNAPRSAGRSTPPRASSPTAYLPRDGFSDRRDTLETAEMDADLAALSGAARDVLRRHFRERDGERRARLVQETSETVKERGELHKILERETWTCCSAVPCVAAPAESTWWWN